MTGYKFEKKTLEEKAIADREESDRLEDDELSRIADIEAGQFEYRLGRLRPNRGLKKLRDELELSQTQMAEKSGVTRRTYQSYENGKNHIPSNVICRLAATYSFDIHMLFAGQAHADNLRVRTDTAKLAADVVLHLIEEFPRMEMHDMQRIAMEFARSNKPGTPVNRGTVYDSIRIATGNTYIPDEIPFSDVGELEPEDFPPDAT